MTGVPVWIWNEIARTQELATLWAMKIFPLDDEELTEILDLQAELMTNLGYSNKVILAYENEWRCFNRQGVHVYPKHLLTGVIFGSRCSNDTHETISHWINLSPLQITTRAVNHHMEFVDSD